MNIAQTVLRVLLVVVCSVSGYLLATQLPALETLGIWTKWIGALVGFIFAILALSLERIIKRVPLKVIFGGTLGLFEA